MQYLVTFIAMNQPLVKKIENWDFSLKLERILCWARWYLILNIQLLTGEDTAHTSKCFDIPSNDINWVLTPQLKIGAVRIRSVLLQLNRITWINFESSGKEAQQDSQRLLIEKYWNCERFT